jgi:outer membrane protein assembly factor BamB
VKKASSMRYLCYLLCILSLAPCESAVVSAQENPDGQWPADSWPQWGGIHRDHKSSASGLLQQWPEAGPAQVWKYTDAGRGFSSFSVYDGRLYTLGTKDGRNYALCLNAGDGTEMWRTDIAAAIPADGYNQDWSGGPRSTPTLAGQHVVVLDDGGTLCCLTRESGAICWSVNLVDDFGGMVPKWGYAASPLVDGNRVVVCPGMDQFMVVLDLETGRKLFTSSGHNERAHYVSLIKHEVDGVPMYVTAAQSGLVAFSAENGAVMWTNKSTGNATATVATPIVCGNLIYHTSAYSAGCALLEISIQDGVATAREIYANQNQQNHHGGVVLVDDLLYGYRRRGGLVCQDLNSGEVKWNERLSGDSSASIAYADHRLYVYGETSGTCYLAEPSAEKWLERGRITLPQQTQLDRLQGKIWAHPVIAEGKLFLRDMDLIYAFDLTRQ